jgi:hypothetical protein
VKPPRVTIAIASRCVLCTGYRMWSLCEPGDLSRVCNFNIIYDAGLILLLGAVHPVGEGGW